MKNKSAQSMAHLRWDKTTKSERKEFSNKMHEAKRKLIELGRQNDTQKQTKSNI